MHNDDYDAENFSEQNNPDATVISAPIADIPPPLDNQQQTTPPHDGVPNDSPRIDDEKPDEVKTADDKPASRVRQWAKESQVGIMNAMTGAYAMANFVSYGHGVNGESQQSLDVYVRTTELHSPSRSYKSIDLSLAGYSGSLRTERILLLTCHDEDIALTVAKSIAYDTQIVRKELVNIDTNSQGRYNFSNLIDALAPPKQTKDKASPQTIYVWDTITAGDDEITSGILDSLLSRNSRVEQYQHWLTERGVCLICVASPERVQTYNDVHFASLRTLEIDFLSPLLERSNLDQYETLVATIRQQRLDGHWNNVEAEFYKDICKRLRNRKLVESIQERTASCAPQLASVETLFDWHDPLIRTVLYCATYFIDLSPQDFSYLVQLLLGDSTEEISKQVNSSNQSNESKTVIESVPLVSRWQRDPDRLLRQCQLAAVRNQDDKRVIDFQVDGLRDRLSKFIREDRFYLYESNFTLLRQQRLLFSPKKPIAEAARQLLVDMAMQYAPNDVANWLYEVVSEFQEMAQVADRLQELTPLYRLLPDVKVKAARRYLSYGLSRILIRLDKEDELREAVRLFWQKLLLLQHEWFIDVLRRMGDSTPADTLTWIKQLLEQGNDEIRNKASIYLVGYLRHRDASIYQTLTELMQWSDSSKAGRRAREVLLAYCAVTNGQIAQQDYGQWPSPHPLFGFQNLDEAQEWLDRLVRWVCDAAFEVDSAKALSIIADIFAGWYFVLSPSTNDESTENAGEVENKLSARAVRELLFQLLSRQSPRGQRAYLIATWGRLQTDLLDEVIFLDAIANRFSNPSLTLQLRDIAATARRKLLGTRTSLTEVRNAFIRWNAIEPTPA